MQQRHQKGFEYLEVELVLLVVGCLEYCGNDRAGKLAHAGHFRGRVVIRCRGRIDGPHKPVEGVSNLETKDLKSNETLQPGASYPGWDATGEEDFRNQLPTHLVFGHHPVCALRDKYIPRHVVRLAHAADASSDLDQRPVIPAVLDVDADVAEVVEVQSSHGQALIDDKDVDVRVFGVESGDDLVAFVGRVRRPD